MIEDGNGNLSSGGQPVPTPATDLPDASDDIDYLRRLLGSAFVDWALAEPSGTLTPAQLEVASRLAQILRQNISNHPELPIEHIIPNLASYDQASGTTLINYARQLAGGTVEKVEGNTGDDLLNAFLAFTAQCYGEMRG